MFQWKFRPDPIWAELDRLQGSEDNLFDAAIGSAIRLSERLWSRARLFPLLNVRESNQSFVVTALIPGMKIEDLQISITGDMLTIEGERVRQEDGEGISYHRRERGAGNFQRSLTLPARIDVEHVGIKYKDGVLTVTLPKEKAAL